MHDNIMTELITALTVISTMHQLFWRVFMFDKLRKQRLSIEGPRYLEVDEQKITSLSIQFLTSLACSVRWR